MHERTGEAGRPSSWPVQASRKERQGVPEEGVPEADILQRFRRLSTVETLEDLPPPDGPDSPGPHCGLFEAALTAPLVGGSRALLIGPAACLYHAGNLHASGSRGVAAFPSELLYLPLEPDDTVFGADGKIAEAVLEADRRFRPEALFLVSTCVPEMAGTDLDALAAELAPRVRARLLVVRTDGFSARHQQQGLRRVLAALISLMAPAPREPLTVNVLGLRAEGARNSELVRTLEGAGVRVLNTVPAATTVAELERSPAAALNVVVEDYALDLAREMEARFGVPYVEVGFPLSPDRVDEAYAQLEAALGVPLGPLVAPAREAAGQSVDRARRAAEGRRAAVAAFAGGPLGAARFLAGAGVEPAVVLVSRFSRQDARERHALLTGGHDPLVGRAQGTGRTAELLRSVGVDLYAGHGDRYALARLGIGHLHPDPPRARWGHEATQWAAEMVAAAVGGGTHR